MKYGSIKIRPACSVAIRNRRAFTLIEIMIVVVILGILAAIVVPQMSGASEAARESTLKDIARYLRTAVTTYRAQHTDVPPGYANGNMGNTPDAGTFVEQMTTYTDEGGRTNATATAIYKFGPYLSKMPANPMSNLSTVTIVSAGSSIPAADNTSGWFYKPDTQEIVPNTTGNDTAGVAFTSY